MIVFINVPVRLRLKLQICIYRTSLHVILNFEPIQVLIPLLLLFQTDLIASYLAHCNFLIIRHRRVSQTLEELDVLFSIYFLKLPVFDQKLLLVLSKPFIQRISHTGRLKPRSLRIKRQLSFSANGQLCFINLI